MSLHYRKYKITRFNEIKYRKDYEKKFIENSLSRSASCSKEEFIAEDRVRKDSLHNNLSIVDINDSNQSVIRKIRTSNKEYYQFIETYYCDECHCLHQKSMHQIPSEVMKKHKIKL
tara:strand:- start:44 stop:391 length:348 start_codon:yes stop_codon:yes gene_type:complete